MEDVLREIAEQVENQETVHVEEVREKVGEMEGTEEEARVFLMENGAKAFRKTLAKKGFVEERGFGELFPPFKEEVERMGWEAVCKHSEPGKRALVNEFYANLGERRNMTWCVRGRWVPFGEKAISQLFRLRRRDCIEYERLQKNPNFEEIAK